MNIDEILTYFAKEIGSPLARMAEPSYWSHEYRYRAQNYNALAGKARTAYRMIRDGQNPKTVLTRLKKEVHGIEGNAIDRLLERI